jgi:tetratricopeptide (TPR) repeat protein
VATWTAGQTATDRLVESQKLGDALASGTIALEGVLDLALSHSKGTDRLLLVIDQFEELFTLAAPEVRARFVEAVLTVSGTKPVTLVLTMRADFTGHALVLSRSLTARMQEGVMLLGPMNRSELREIIERPALVGGLSFEPGLVERILEQIEGEPGSLPLLEFALTELWNRRRDGKLTHEALNAFGDVRGAISDRADKTFKRLDEHKKAILRRCFGRLVTVSAASEGGDTRRRARWESFMPEEQQVLELFIAARLLFTSHDAATNAKIVEVAHETLIMGWGVLKETIAGARNFWVWRQQLELLVSVWERLNRDSRALLRGKELEEATRHLAERPQEFNPDELTFLEASTQEARKQASADVAAQRLRNLRAGARKILLWSIPATAVIAFSTVQIRDTAWFQFRELIPTAMRVRDVDPEGAYAKHRLSWLRALALDGRSSLVLKELERVSLIEYESDIVTNALAVGGAIEDAERLLTKAGLSDEGGLAFYRLGSVLRRTGREEDALREFAEAEQRFRAFNTKNPDGLASGLSYVALGLSSFKNGQSKAEQAARRKTVDLLAEAERTLQPIEPSALAAIRPRRVSTLSRLGRAALRSGNTQLAMTMVAEAERLFAEAVADIGKQQDPVGEHAYYLKTYDVGYALVEVNGLAAAIQFYLSARRHWDTLGKLTSGASRETI